jgi:hypothetical protein
MYVKNNQLTPFWEIIVILQTHETKNSSCVHTAEIFNFKEMACVETTEKLSG